MDPTFLAIWLAMSSAFHAGALHLQQGDYAAAVTELNQVFLAPKPAKVLDWQARLLRGEALMQLGQRDAALIDLVAAAQSPEEPFSKEANALLDEFGATDRERLPPHLLVEAFDRACRSRDLPAALAYCLTDTARAQLRELWDDEGFQAGMAATKDGETKPLSSREQHPYAHYMRVPTMPDLTLFLGFDQGWYITSMVVGLPRINNTFDQPNKVYQLENISTCVMEYRRAHDGHYPSAFTKDQLPTVYESSVTEFNAFRQDRPNSSLYMPPPDGLDKAALASWILFAHDTIYSGYYRQVVYANGHIGMVTLKDYHPRIAAQRAQLPPD